MSLRGVKSLLWAVVGAAAVVLIARYRHGLGAATALTDTTPWGLWKSVNVLGGVALAAGGFSMAAAVYIFHLDRYHKLARRAVVIAFFGYGTVIVSLAFDLGDPWNIWRPILHWQTHSVMFEVAWCVMLYFLVLTVEVGVVVLEHTRFQRIYRLLKRISIPAVILGIGLSTLHQSSLGSLFLITPHRLHALWYSPILPLLFIVSAIALGLLVVAGETLVSSALYRHEADLEAAAGIGRVAGWLLVAYGVLRLGDLAYRGAFSELELDAWEGWMFLAEMAVACVVPALLLLIRPIRESRRGLFWAVGLVVVGMLVNRINSSGLSRVQLTGDHYLPAWTEVTLSAGVMSAAVLGFFFLVEHFAVYEKRLVDPSSSTGTWRRVSDAMIPKVACGDREAGLRAHSLAFVVSAAVTLALLPDSALYGAQPLPTPVHRARGGNTLLIDGNRNGDAVAFGHASHIQSIGKGSCRKCHHMSVPYDQATPCSACHRDMWEPTDIFSHERHIRHLGDKHSCRACHRDHDQPKVRENTRACVDCHHTMWSPKTLAHLRAKAARDPRVLSRAMGYRDALHRKCIGCHRKKAKEYEMPEMARCAFCHKPLGKKVLKLRRELQGSGH